MNAEEWRTVVSNADYEVSTHGRIRSHKRRIPRVMSPRELPKGYQMVTLRNDKGCRNAYVHALVLEAFVGARPAGMQARHLDGDPRNNRLGNLAWGTKSENERDKRRHGTQHNVNKTECLRGHAYTPENTYIQPGTTNKRSCITCRNDAQRRNRERRRIARQEAAA